MAHSPFINNGVTQMFYIFLLDFTAIWFSLAMLIALMILGHHQHGNVFHHFAVFDSNRKVGGIRFLRIGRLNISFSIARKEAK
jgi:hypothetical protein